MWSIEDYCAANLATYEASPPMGPRMAQFVEALGLPMIHPFCTVDVANRTEWFAMGDVPPMGPLDTSYDAESHPSWWSIATTLFFRVAPPLWAMIELWMRLFACTIGPGGVAYLMATRFSSHDEEKRTEMSTKFLLACYSIVASSLVLMTDTLYVLEWNVGDDIDVPVVGIALFASSIVLVMNVARKYNNRVLSLYVLVMMLLAMHLIWDRETNSIVFGRDMPRHYFDNDNATGDASCRSLFKGDQKLYFDDQNDFVRAIVDNWDEGSRSYPLQGTSTGREGRQAPTPWTVTGDSRTGIPFLFHTVDYTKPRWTRVYLPTIEDDEVVALDIATPEDESKNNGIVYLILHGLNGGSNENYVRDMAQRETILGATVIVMIARGLMDLPVRGWNNFNGARTSDMHAAATAVRNAIEKIGNAPVLIGVGYSMGGIVLNNYVATYGDECRLDGAVSLSGGLDLRLQTYFQRAQRLWHPMLAEALREDFLLGKWGQRVRRRLSASQFRRLMRAPHVTEIDRHAIVPYNKFDDLDHYYRSMSALGDISLDDYGRFETADLSDKKISRVSVPLVVLHAIDDPLVTWRTVAAKSGLMRPENLVKTGKGNLLIALTKGGGHVGWPVGTLSFLNNWNWMSSFVAGFSQAVRDARDQRKSRSPE